MQDTPGIVAVVLDGFNIPVMVLCALLEVFSRVDRHGSALVVLVGSESFVNSAETHWKQLSSQDSRSQRTAALVIGCQAQDSVVVYGLRNHRASTWKDRDGFLRTTDIRCPVDEVFFEARRQLLAESLDSPDIRHSDGAYLIDLPDGGYFTRTFFEIPKLLTRDSTRAMLKNWLRGVIEHLHPSCIVLDAPSLSSVVRDALAAAPAGQRPEIVQSDHELPAATGLRALRYAGEDGTVLVLSDVFCSSRFLREFIVRYRDPSKVIALAVVDARSTPHEYETVDTTDGPVPVPVLAAHREQIETSSRRPAGVSQERLFRIDRLTRRPTVHRTLPQREDERVLLERLEKARALSVGHFLLNDRHLMHYVLLAKAFRELEEEIGEWLGKEKGLASALGGASTKMRILCLDEVETFSASLANNARKQWSEDVNFVARQVLAAPPVQSSDQGGTVWWILPIASTARTIRRCLEYSNALGATATHVSVVVSRVDHELALLLSRMSGYANFETALNAYLSLGIPGDPEECAMCSMIRSMEEAAASVGSGRASLQEMIRQEIALLKPIPVTPGVHPPVSPLPESENVWKEIYIRGAYIRAMFDPRHQASLKSELIDPQMAHALAAASGPAAIGAQLGDGSPVHEEQSMANACRVWAKREATDHDPGAFHRQLRGYARLGPVNTIVALRRSARSG